ncbi:MAG: hypothetical protein KDH89_08675 [Anaerolineae bacterium]|nr:hypothetical protein [Anaerolineae bacterium]
MRRLIGVTILVAGVVLAVMVGQRMSTDAMTVVVGVVFGVAASIPTSLLVVAATRSRREEGYRLSRDELRSPQPAPPQVYVVNPGKQPGQSNVPWLPGAMQGQWPGVPGTTGGNSLYAAGQPPRRFKVVGEDERWLEEPSYNVIDMINE